ncbi:hypothetical protein BGX38DRAFT_347546 [Terfezia claveryi]|nr:hypothetical protein BGX38DRAFT_347546 [Terfezia claveryi]
MWSNLQVHHLCLRTLLLLELRLRQAAKNDRTKPLQSTLPFPLTFSTEGTWNYLHHIISRFCALFEHCFICWHYGQYLLPTSSFMTGAGFASVSFHCLDVFHSCQFRVMTITWWYFKLQDRLVHIMNIDFITDRSDVMAS